VNKAEFLRQPRHGKEVKNLEHHAFETTDIFRGAFLLCNGARLDGIRIQDGRKRIASFLIRGKGLTDLDRTYRQGQALVNPLHLKESLNHLRDELFEILRTNERRTRYARKESPATSRKPRR